MAIRLSGLTSGMDTEAIVGALMSAQSLKKTKISNAKTKLEWKQTKWQDLNSKLYKFYTDQVSKMQMTSAYKTKKATVSDPSKASVNANTNAVNGSYTLAINNIATSEYLTSAALSNISKGTQKMSEIDASLVNSEINITVGKKKTKFVITENTTINDFTSALSKAGLNASFDSAQHRFFISSKESGMANAFSLTSSKISDAQLNATADLKAVMGYDKMSSDNKKVVDKALETLKTSGVGTDKYNEALDSLVKAKNNEAATTLRKAQIYAEKYAENKEAAEKARLSSFYEVDEDGNRTGVKEELIKGYTENFNNLVDEDKAIIEQELGIDITSGTEEENLNNYINAVAERDYQTAVAQNADAATIKQVNKEITSAENKVAIEALTQTGATADEIKSMDSTEAGFAALAKYYGYGNDTAEPISGFGGMDGYNNGTDDIADAIAASVSNYASLTERYDPSAASALGKMGLAEIEVTDDGMTVNGSVVSDTVTLANGMAFIAASDSEIVLNGAKLTSSTATVSANGLSIDLTGKTAPGETITFSVATDVDAIYNSIKETLKGYNEIMKEMYDSYSAASAKGYEPLSKEEKEAMTDEDVKLYEDKIKGALLRGDTTLNGIMSAMRTAMQSQVEYDGKKYSLSSFGIMTSFDYTEGGLYHIYGDKDDSVYADRQDKLRTALEQDPEAVVNVLSKVFGNLRSTMSDKMAGSKVSSALTFYNDIKIKEDIKGYQSDIEDWEDRLAAMEDAYYKKFTAMEVAMAKLQSQQSSLAGLFGN